MLKLKNITKVYQTESLRQTALNDISINFRKCEFASILGPSGSGKTTLLNIIGGLDHYDSGDLIIDGISTKEYKDRDWDGYRNHRIGFVFQSYNLISHQSVLSNVELALTLTGVSKKERRKRAVKALTDVGLIEHIHKKPSELSGGQMQRVAIARALVNNPDIVLADEPTGALDSETSIQIMELLKRISEDKLVIMVTHNPELADTYSNRIIKLKDGVITSDSNPYSGLEKSSGIENTKKTSMSLFTALSLSLNNLMTKKGRTILTSFAGSIGIIGIALILSLSNGVNNYISRVEKETLAGYPIKIEATTFDSSTFASTMKKDDYTDCDSDSICTNDDITDNPYLKVMSSIVKNNLKDFKKYIDSNEEIEKYTTDIKYGYNIDLNIYSKDNTNSIVKVNPNNKNEFYMDYNSFSNKVSSDDLLKNSFEELISSEDLLNSQYEVLYGSMPVKYNDLVLVVDSNNNIPLSVAYSLNIESRTILDEIVNDINNSKKVKIKDINYSYEDLINKEYKLILNTDFYRKENGVWKDYSSNLNELYENGTILNIVGIIRAKKDATNASSGFIGYTHDLVDYVINEINNKEITKEQLSNKKINVFTNTTFNGFNESYEDNLEKLGIVSLDDPKEISIYPKDFNSKESILDIIDKYNDEITDSDEIVYNDVVGSLLSGITTIVNVISYILIAFVAISLVVSSIMIAIITYISVLERTKEIGILRAIGASKKDVTRVFNAETIIEGFISGVMGIGVTLLLCIPVNVIVNVMFKVNNIASLPIIGAIILIVISVLLTTIAGLIPSRLASKKDPVESLRTE